MTEQLSAPNWRPRNAVEARMLAALDSDNRQEYFKALLTAPLYLPQTVTDPETATDASDDDYLTFTAEDVTYLLVFTSVETMQECVGHVANGYVESDFDMLRSGLEGSEMQLGINLGTPIDAWLDAESLARAASGEIAVPTGQEMAELMELNDPENAEVVDEAAERELATFVDDYLTGLIEGDVIVPTHNGSWRVAPVDGVVTVEVFSVADLVPAGLETATVPFLSLVAKWPESAEILSVNPDTPLAFTMPAEILKAFARTAQLIEPPQP